MKIPDREDKRNGELIALYRQYKPLSFLIKKYGITKTRIYQILNKYGVARNRPNKLTKKGNR